MSSHPAERPWLSANPDRSAFSRTEMFQQLKDRRYVTSSDGLAPVFKLLTDPGYIRPLDPNGQGKPAPVPEAYSVNPLWVRAVAE